MDKKQVESMFNELIDMERRIFSSKGDDYTNDDSDRLANFKRNAKLTGMTSGQVWSIYFMKHIDAILTYIRTGKLSSEGLIGRINDARNYLVLLACLFQEAQDEASKHE